MAEDFQVVLQRSIAAAGGALAKALPPSVLEQATLTAHADGLRDLERALVTKQEWNDVGFSGTLQGLDAARGGAKRERPTTPDSALSLSVVALATALKVYGTDPQQLRPQALPQAVVLARAYADTAAALPRSSGERPADDAPHVRDREDVKPVVIAVIDMIQDADAPDSDAPLVELLSQCLVDAAQAPSASSPWAVMRIYGAQLATL